MCPQSGTSSGSVDQSFPPHAAGITRHGLANEDSAGAGGGDGAPVEFGVLEFLPLVVCGLGIVALMLAESQFANSLVS